MFVLECPKCKKTVGENDAVCRNCGVALKENTVRKRSKGLLGRRKSDKYEIAVLETTEHKKKRFGVVDSKTEKKLKIIFLAVACILIVVLIWILILQLSGNKGKKMAAEAAEFIGSSITTAEKELEIHFKDDSSFGIINNSLSFDYIYESDESLKIDDITYPEWSVMITKDSSESIESVIFTDYAILKKDSRGEKLDKRINLDKFEKGDKYSSVSDEFDFDPFKITYTDDAVSYLYKYHYTDPTGDAQSVLLNIVFDKQNKFLYYTSVDIYPQNM